MKVSDARLDNPASTHSQKIIQLNYWLTIRDPILHPKFQICNQICRMGYQIEHRLE